MNTITNRFQVEELEQRLEMGKWSLSAEANGSVTVSSNGTSSATGNVGFKATLTL